MLDTLIGGLIGFVAAIFAEPVRQWLYRPKLRLSFGQSDEYQSRTPAQLARTRAVTAGVITVHTHHIAIYLRVKVENTKPAIAKHCRAYLVGVEKMGADRQFGRTIYCDSIPLAWSCRASTAKAGEEFKPVDIPFGVSQFVDILSTISDATEEWEPGAVSKQYDMKLSTMPNRYRELFTEHGIFRLTVQVSSENARPCNIKVHFEWEGVWDKIRAW